MAIYKRLPLKLLEVNPANDRHGDLGSEAAAIEWLLVNKTEKMKDLLHNIVEKNGIVEAPLVMKKQDDEKYIVYDGNRRVTCLKLISGIAPEHINNPLDKKLAALKANNNIDIDAHVECRVEDDVDLINDILELRHIPGNSGAGQLKWDGHEKENFLDRTGKSKKINFAKEINQILIEKEYLNPHDRIPLSTFNRLCSSKEMKRRVGVDIQDNKIQLINELDTSYKAMARIAKDMIAGEVTLDDVWNKAKKTAYLDELEKEGVLPSAKDRLKKSKPVGEDDKSKEKPQPRPKSPAKRDYLLPTNLPTPEHNEFLSIKFCQLFYELQNTLQFSHHLISISITFRAFLEILTRAYLKKHKIDEKGSLSQKIKSAFLEMQKHSKMPEEVRVFVNKLSDENEYFSINTLHKVTHNDMQISDNDLRSYVNNLDAYIRESIDSINGSSDIN